MIQRLVMRLSLAALVAFLAIIVTEVLFSVWELYPASPSFVQVEADGRGSVSFRIQSHRHPERLVTVKRVPPSGSRRVVLLGDAGIYASALRPGSTLASMLQRRLHERLGGQWQIVDLSVPEPSMANLHQLGKLAIEELHPEIVLLHGGHDEFLPVHVSPLVDRVEHPLLDRLLRPLRLLRVGRALHWVTIGRSREFGWGLLGRSRQSLQAESRLDAVREGVADAFEEQLGRLAAKAREARCRFVLIESFANRHEFGPLVSVASRLPDQSARKSYRQGLEKVAKAFSEGRHEAGLKRLDELEALDGAVASSWHLRAQHAWQAGNATEARRLELRAAGFDERPIVASEVLLQRLQAVADVEALEVLSTWKSLEIPSEEGEPAKFIDAHQPTVYGQYLLACSLAAGIDPGGETMFDAYPKELDERLADYRRLLEHMEIDQRVVVRGELRRALSLIEWAAMCTFSEPALERARAAFESAVDGPRSGRWLEADWLLAMLEGDSQRESAVESRLRSENPKRYRALSARLREHPRLRSWLEPASSPSESGQAVDVEDGT